jgi:hypothetical protein
MLGRAICRLQVDRWFRQANAASGLALLAMGEHGSYGLWGGFMELTLNTEEQKLLLSIIDRRHQELLTEIVHTDNREFKQELRKDEKLLDSLLSRVRAAAVQELHV